MSNFITLLRLLLVVALSHQVSGLFEGHNPMSITLKKVTRCANMGKDSILYSVSFKKINDTNNSISFNTTVPFDINNDVTVNMLLMSKGMNGKYSLLMERSFKACDWKSLLSGTKLPGLEELFRCPLPKGVYQTSRPSDTFTINAPPVTPTGDFKVESSLYTHKEGKSVKETCYTLYLSIKRQ